MGHGPRVPATRLALALGLDRIRATTRTGAAVVRLHPAGSTLPVVLLSAAAVVFVLMATVSIHVLPGPKSSDQSPVIGGVTPGPTSSVPRVSRSAAPPVMVPGHSGDRNKAPGRLAAGQPESGGSAASDGRSAVGDQGGVAVFGSVPGQTGTGTGTAAGTGAGGSGSGSGSGGSGSGSGSGGSGTSAGSSGSGAGTGTTAGSATGSGSGATSGSGGTGSSGSGTGITGSGGTGSGGTGAGAGSGGTGSTGSGTSGTGGTGSGSGSSGGSGGGLCVTLLGIQACVG
jgi:hypothetical protein